MEYIDIDSTNRDRAKFPLQADFDVLIPINTLCGLTKTIKSPVTGQCISYPNPQEFNQIAFYTENVRETIGNTVEIYNLPLMYSNDTNTIVYLDELVIRSDDFTNVLVTDNSKYPRGTVPLGQNNEFYTGDYIEDVLNNEFRKITFFEYRTADEIILQTGQIIDTAILDNFYIYTRATTATFSALSNISRYYVGKQLKITSGNASGFTSFIKNYIPGSVQNTIEIDNPGKVLSFRDTFQIVTDRQWFATIESPFTNPLPSYPCFTEPIPNLVATFYQNIIYTSTNTIDFIAVGTQNPNGLGLIIVEKNTNTYSFVPEEPTDQYAQYDFQNSLDLGNDASGNTFSGTVTGSIVHYLTYEGQTNAIEFTQNPGGGTATQYIDISAHAGSFSGLTSLSVSAWLNFRDDAALNVAISFSDSANATGDELILYSNAGDISWGLAAPAQWTYTLTGGVINDGAWHHVVGIMGASGAELWVDGVRKATNANTNSFPQMGAMNSIFIGCNRRSGGFLQAWEGFVAEVQFFNRALTFNEITALGGNPNISTVPLADIKYIESPNISANSWIEPVTVFEDAYNTRASLTVPLLYTGVNNSTYRPLTNFASPPTSMENPSSTNPIFITNHLSNDTTGSSWRDWPSTGDEQNDSSDPFTNLDFLNVPYQDPTIFSTSQQVTAGSVITTYAYVAYKLRENDLDTIYWSYNVNNSFTWTTITVEAATFTGEVLTVVDVGIFNNRPWIIFVSFSTLISRYSVNNTGSDLGTVADVPFPNSVPPLDANPYIKFNVWYGRRYSFLAGSIKTEWMIPTVDNNIPIQTVEIFVSDNFLFWHDSDELIVWRTPESDNLIGLHLISHEPVLGNLTAYIFGWKSTGGLQLSTNPYWLDDTNFYLNGRGWSSPIVVDTHLIRDFTAFINDDNELIVIYTRINDDGVSEVVSLHINEVLLGQCRPYRIRKGVPLLSNVIPQGVSNTQILLPSSISVSSDIYTNQFIHVYNRMTYNVPSPMTILNEFTQIKSFDPTTNIITLNTPLPLDFSNVPVPLPQSEIILEFQNSIDLGEDTSGNDYDFTVQPGGSYVSSVVDTNGITLNDVYSMSSTNAYLYRDVSGDVEIIPPDGIFNANIYKIPFSFSIWVYHDSTTSGSVDPHILYFLYSSGLIIRLYLLTSNLIKFSIGNGTIVDISLDLNTLSGSLSTDNQWHMYTFIVRQNMDVIMYIDERRILLEEFDFYDIPGGVVSGLPIITDIYVGTDPSNDTNNHWGGFLKNFILSKEEFTTTQITNMYQQGLGNNFYNMAFEILGDITDYYEYLNYVGKNVLLNSSICYEVELTHLILPNVILSSGFGNRIAFYPYVYVEFSETNTSSFNKINSNNPAVRKKYLFKVPIRDTSTPDRATFVNNTSGMKHIMKFNPQTNFHFAVYLPTGELFITSEVDNTSPLPPNNLLQISATFGFKRLK